jgi:TolA-binding protein
MEKEEKKVEEVIEKKDETIVEPKKDNEKTAEELKAEAEALEAEIKELKEKGQGDEYKNNQLIRLEKARAKKEALTSMNLEKKEEGIDTRDLIILAKHDIGEDSEKAKILAKYKAGGLIKDYSEGLNHIAIKAEFEALDAVNNAKTVIDENDTDEVKVKTTKEVINSYRNSGEVPSDVKLQKAIAEDNLKTMGI